MHSGGLVSGFVDGSGCNAAVHESAGALFEGASGATVFLAKDVAFLERLSSQRGVLLLLQFFFKHRLESRLLVGRCGTRRLFQFVSSVDSGVKHGCRLK